MKAALQIQTLLRDEITTIKNCYFTPPFKIMNITEDKRGGDLHLMLMSSSPGILDEDVFEITKSSCQEQPIKKTLLIIKRKFTVCRIYSFFN